MRRGFEYNKGVDVGFMGENWEPAFDHGAADRLSSGGVLVCTEKMVLLCCVKRNEVRRLVCVMITWFVRWSVICKSQKKKMKKKTNRREFHL